MTDVGLRERKKQRTWHALQEAATRLFATQGYVETTVAQIADAAGVSTKTLFNYFGSKEDILFAHRRRRIAFMEERLAERGGTMPPGQALLSMAEDLLHWLLRDTGELSVAEQLEQARLIVSVPELQGGALTLLHESIKRLAAVLHASHPDAVSRPEAAAATGALITAMQSAALDRMAEAESIDEIVAAARHAATIVAQGIESLGRPANGQEPAPDGGS